MLDKFMKIEEIERAAELVVKLKQAKKVSEQLDNADVASIEKEYWSTLSQHSDGSGWSVDLNGVVDASKVIAAVKKVVDTRVAELTVEIDVI